jgi:hypothetical protein
MNATAPGDVAALNEETATQRLPPGRTSHPRTVVQVTGSSTLSQVIDVPIGDFRFRPRQPGEVGTRKRFLYAAGLIAAVSIGYLPITRIMVRQGDFPNHIRRAEALAQGEVPVPHVLFHALTAAGVLHGLPPTAAATVVTLGFQVLAAWGVSWLARRSGASDGVAMFLGICVVFVAPILPRAIAAEGYLSPPGYFLPNTLNNPTVTAAKAFVPFLIELGLVVSGAHSVMWSSSRVALGVILAALAKPHYVSCLLPVVLAAWTWRWWTGHQVSWSRILSFTSAALVVLLWTVIGTTELAGGGTAIFSPLTVLRSWGGDVPVDAWSILGRACSDLAFPLAILVLWPDARRFPPLLLAWAAYGVGVGQGLLLAESGHRMYDGNFMWSPQLATFGVMAASAAWLGRSNLKWNWRVIAAWAFLLLHVMSGAWWIGHRVAAR